MLLVQFGYDANYVARMPVWKRKYIANKIQEINKPKDKNISSTQ